MRQFARPYPIERLSLEARILYTGFLAFLLAGLASSAWLYRDSFGSLGAEAATVYYRGEDAPPARPAPSEAPAGGPALDLPGGLELPPEAAATELRLEKSARQVVETFHFHLFTVPVVLLIVGHLFMLTALSTRAKVAWLSLASVATFVHLLAPLLVRFGSPSLGFVMPASVVAAALGWTPLLVWPLWEMWRPRADDGAEA